MDDSGFPKTVEDVVATLADIYRHQAQSEVVELLESSSARIEQTDYDNWNGGTYSYSLMLDVPVPIFAGIEPKLDKIEESISSKLGIVCRNLGNHYLSSTTITPMTSKATAVGPKAKPAEFQVKHIWDEGLFRLFLSHVSAHKVAVGNLKSELRSRGISAFVAHEDIFPSLEWQNEIELALRSMDALAALLTPDFHQSNWTDQEIGFALGKGVLVVPVRLGIDPYGFIGKVQGLRGSLESPGNVADLLLSTLLSNSTTHRAMRKSLVLSFAKADSREGAAKVGRVISTMTDFTNEERAAIREACENNSHVVGAPGLVSLVSTATGIQVGSKSRVEEEIPF